MRLTPNIYKYYEEDGKHTFIFAYFSVSFAPQLGPMDECPAPPAPPSPPPTPTPTPTPEPSSNGTATRDTVIGVVVGLVLAAALAVGIIIYIRRRGRSAYDRLK